MKKCNKCGLSKPTTEFHKRALSPDGLSHKCNLCTAEYYATYIKPKRQSVNNRSSHLARSYGITTEQYEQLLAIQGGACGLCKRPAESFIRRLAVDHDHKCCPTIARSCGKCIRGLLCSGCNTMLGRIESGAVSLDDIRKYVNKPKFAS